MKSFVSTLHYCLTAATIILTAIIFLKIDYVPFPDAEWKMELYILATIWLAWLFPPAAVVTFLFLKENRERIGKLNFRARRLVFTPAILSGCAFAFWSALWILGVVNISL